MSDTRHKRLTRAKLIAIEVLLPAFMLPVAGVAADTEVPSCPKDSRVGAACYAVHGRLNNWNGNPTRRIWVIGTKRMLGLRDGTELPAVLKKPLSDFNHQVVGDFEFCPFTAQKSGVMQVGCVAAVSNYEIKERKQ